MNLFVVELPPLCHDPGDAAIAALPRLLDADSPPIVLGEGPCAYAALLLALGGRASGLVLVDGLGGPYPASADEAMVATYAWARKLADDPAGARGVFPFASTPTFDRLFRGQIDVPVLVIETAASPTPAGEVDERVAMFEDASLLRVSSADPDVIHDAVVARFDG